MLEGNELYYNNGVRTVLQEISNRTQGKFIPKKDEFSRRVTFWNPCVLSFHFDNDEALLTVERFFCRGTCKHFTRGKRHFKKIFVGRRKEKDIF